MCETDFKTSEETSLLLLMEGISAIITAQIINYPHGIPEVYERLSIISGQVFSLLEILKEIIKSEDNLNLPKS